MSKSFKPSISIKNKQWELKVTNEKRLVTIMQKHNLCDIVARILVNTNLEMEQIPSFLDPKLKNLIPDPYHLLDMDKAVMRTIIAIKSNQKICIFGDYDVDGATSSALLKNFFSDIGFDNIVVYIPDRISEGYGLNMLSLESLKAKNINLIITVDCGTLAFEAVEAANLLNIDTVVIDHHLSAETLPKACAIVNPNRLDESSEYKYLAAVGVSYFFIIALMKRLKSEGHFDNFTEPNLLKYLDLVALGTVCDVMPLIGLNRAFVKSGLKVLAGRSNQGLAALSDIAQLQELPTSYHLGFILGPRINAGGRVGQSCLGSKLLTCTNYNEALQYALQLNEFNSLRKIIEQQILEEAFLVADQYKDDAMIIIAQEKWHIGIIGIIAGKLKEHYNKPVAVIAISGAFGKASCRSILNVNLGSMIVEAKLQNLLVEGGGHAMAAGFTIDTNKIDELRSFLCEKIEQNTMLDKCNIYEFDAYLNVNSLTLDLANKLELLQPFGNSNPEPIFKIDNLYVLSASVVGGKHVSCLLSSQRNHYGSSALRAIAFNAINTPIKEILLSSKPLKIAIIGNLKINKFNNTENVNFIIHDIIIEN